MTPGLVNKRRPVSRTEPLTEVDQQDVRNLGA